MQEGWREDGCSRGQRRRPFCEQHIDGRKNVDEARPVCLSTAHHPALLNSPTHSTTTQTAAASSSSSSASSPSSVPPSGSGALVVAEHSAGELSPATLSAVAAACQLLFGSSSSSSGSSKPHPITVLVAGDDAAGVASAAAAAASSVAAMLSSSGPSAAAAAAASSRVLTAVHPRLGHGLAEGLAQLVADLSSSRGGGGGGDGAGSSSSGNGSSSTNGVVAPFAAVAAPGSTFGRNLLPRAAALASRDMVSDVVAVDAGGSGALTRPIYAGAALETVEFRDGGARFFTARPSAFPVAVAADPSSSSPPPLPVEALPASEVEASVSSASPAASWLEDSGGDDSSSGRPDLGAARVVVAGGRALADAAGFAALARLADAFGPGVAAVGASRAAVDAGLAPNELQVGQTGRVVAPELYVAVGISGAAQHVAGMKSSKCIVAINTDGDCPIFSVADYGLVGDWREALPKLEEAVRARRK